MNLNLTDEELKQLLVEAAKEGIKEYKKEVDKAKKKEKYHNTYKLMMGYRDAVFHVDNAISESSQVLDDENDEQRQQYLRSVRKTKFKTMLMLAHIDKMVDKVKEKYEQNGKQAEYEAFEMYFMQGMSYAEIADELNAGINTPRRWVNGVLDKLSVLLWGLEEPTE